MAPGERPTIPVIAGPTAVGKSSIAVDVAEQFKGEIISCDSRQVYRLLNIGTARPDAIALQRVPHHLVDSLDPSVTYSAGIFARRAEELIRDILKRERIPFVVGGSTLYIQALIEGLADIPEIDPDVRRRFNQRLKQEGGRVLFEELRTKDPAFAATLDETKTQRIVRGLEVLEGTGKPLSSFHERQREHPYDYRLIVLTRPRADLYRRIERRVEQMMEAGLLDEVRTLMAIPSVATSEALSSIAYRELIDHLEGRTSFERAVELIKRNTRRYAKRQLTWFRRYEDAIWIDVNKAGREEAIGRIVEAVSPRVRP